jgi:heme-degrading monooxygenase HmoA
MEEVGYDQSVVAIASVMGKLEPDRGEVKMLLERTELLIREGQEEAFSAAMKDQGVGKLASVPGVMSVAVGRGVENPGKFMLLIEWENMDAHAAYNKAPVCGEIRALIGRFSKGGSMEHFQMA